MDVNLENTMYQDINNVLHALKDNIIFIIYKIINS